MDFDFLTGLAEIGSSRGRWKSLPAVLFGVLGALLGGYLGFTSEGLTAGATGAFVGGVFGWFLVSILTGALLILALTLVFGLAVGAWIWLTGGAT